MICEKCGKEFFEDWRKDKRARKTPCRFCCRSCSNSKERSAEYKKKISKIMKNSEKVKKNFKEKMEKSTKERWMKPRIIKICPVCGKEMLLTETVASYKIYCSAECYSKVSGGYREGCVKNHKHGKYEGYYYDSSWELSWIKWAIQKDKFFVRNTTGFPYVFENKKHLYYPDFYIPEDDRYVEVKGYKSEQWEVKKESFPFELEVIGKKEIKDIREEIKDYEYL